MMELHYSLFIFDKMFRDNQCWSDDKFPVWKLFLTSAAAHNYGKYGKWSNQYYAGIFCLLVGQEKGLLQKVQIFCKCG